jgi:hypothetical protein
MVIWQGSPVKIYHKTAHIRWNGDKVRYAFTIDYGDIPVGNLNEITMKFEPCVNTRGHAYAARKRFSYRKRKY